MLLAVCPFFVMEIVACVNVDRRWSRKYLVKLFNIYHI